MALVRKWCVRGAGRDKRLIPARHAVSSWSPPGHKHPPDALPELMKPVRLIGAIPSHYHAIAINFAETAVLALLIWIKPIDLSTLAHRNLRIFPNGAIHNRLLY